MTSINDVRNAAYRVYGTQPIAIDEKYATVNHRDGKTSKTGKKLYRISSNGFAGEWMTSKEIVERLTETAEKLGR